MTSIRATFIGVLCLSSAYDRQPISLTPTYGAMSHLVHGGVAGAFVDMLSRQNYVYLQSYLPATDVRPATSLGDPSTAATGSLTDLFGRVAVVPESQDTAGEGQKSQLNSPGSSVSVIVSKVGSTTPTQPVTMFRIVSGPSSQPHHIMAYRHRSDDMLSLIHI